MDPLKIKKVRDWKRVLNSMLGEKLEYSNPEDESDHKNGVWERIDPELNNGYSLIQREMKPMNTFILEGWDLVGAVPTVNGIKLVVQSPIIPSGTVISDYVTGSGIRSGQHVQQDRIAKPVRSVVPWSGPIEVGEISWTRIRVKLGARSVRMTIFISEVETKVKKKAEKPKIEQAEQDFSTPKRRAKLKD